MSDLDRVLQNGATRVYPMMGRRIASYQTVTADTTLTSKGPRKIRLDATSGIMTVTMPSDCAEGDEWIFYEIAGIATAVTLVPAAGHTISGLASFLMNGALRSRAFIFDSVSSDWINLGGGN